MAESEMVRHILDEAPVSVLMRDTGRPAWEQILALFDRFKMPPPPGIMRDELVTMLLWARHGERLDAALQEDTQ